MKFFRQAALCAAILSSLTGSALAQGLGGNASISATTSSGSSPVQFPLAGAANQNSFTSAIIAPATGTSVEAFYAIGPTNAVTATANTSASLPSGGICLTVSPTAYIAAVTGTGTASIRITMVSGCTEFAGGGGGSGGGGGGAVYGATSAGSAATTAPVLVAGTQDGTGTGIVQPWKVGTGGIGFINCSNCSGSGISVGFGSAIGSVGTPNGYKDGSGNFQPILGDITNGQWVAIKSSVSLAVTGTFWPYTLGQQVNGSSVPVVLTAAQLTTLTPPAAITGFALDTTVQATNTALATINTDIGQTNTNLGPPGTTVCATDTGSCPLNALSQRTNQRLSTINSTLGSPFQANGVIGNTAFGISGTLPAFASIPTFSINQGTPGTTNLVSIGSNGTVNPATPNSWGVGAFASVMPTVGSATGIFDGTNLVRARGDETNGIWVNIKSGAGSGGTAIADEAAFTQGTTQGTPAFGLYSTSVTNLTNGQTGILRSTNDRQLLVQDGVLGTDIGAPGATACSSDTGSCSTNQQLQRIAQNLTTLNTTASQNIPGVTGPLAASSSALATYSLITGAQYLSTQPTMTNLQQGSMLLSSRGELLVVPGTSGFPVTLASTTITGTVAVTESGSWTVTANAGTNLNTSALALETGGNLATLVTDFGAPGATACTTDTASCSLNQQMQRNNQRLTTINTTLGTPFQAGGSIGNTTFAVTQATAANLNATVVGTGTFAVQAAQSGSWTVTANAGTNLNTSLLALETGGNLATIAGAVSSSKMQSNTAQVNGVTISTGAGAIGTGSQRIAVGQDTTTIAGSAPGTAGTPSANIVTVQGASSMTPVAINQTQVNGATLSVTNPTFTEITDGSHGAAATKAASTPAAATDIALVVDQRPGTIVSVQSNGANLATAANQSTDPCQTNATKVRTTISFSTTGLQTTPIVAGTSAKKTYICQIILNNAGADNIAIIGATTGTSCGTGAYGLYGGTTAATGMNLSANSGFVDGNGGYAANFTTNNNDDICMNHSGSTQVSGKILTVQQ